jgi:squalene-hopene/tetraprenyl-beta-curcumene cyclase
MKYLSTILLFFCFYLPGWGVKPTINLSIKQEIERSLDLGLNWLNKEQNRSSGNWGIEEYPALTGLAVRSFLGHPSPQVLKKYAKTLEGGLSFIRSKVQSDGGIYGKGLASYNTSICLMALMQHKDQQDDAIIQAARKFLINQQSDFDNKGESDNVFDGGVGYGSRWAHSDLSNTHLAMEALFYAKKTYQNKEGEGDDLDWDAAIAFVTKCQNLPSTNKEKWVSDHQEDRGGFVYFPGSSMAGERQNTNGSIALRSYGSMSYAGLLSFIYAEMDSQDPRVLAVKEWLTKHYTIKENPGMGPQGLFYYYHTMAKALTLSRITTISDEKGVSQDWRKELALHLLNLQSKDGSWINDNGRWWEKDPVLVTSYALLTLERIYYDL